MPRLSDDPIIQKYDIFGLKNVNLKLFLLLRLRAGKCYAYVLACYAYVLAPELENDVTPMCWQMLRLRAGKQFGYFCFSVLSIH